MAAMSATSTDAALAATSAAALFRSRERFLGGIKRRLRCGLILGSGVVQSLLGRVHSSLGRVHGVLGILDRPGSSLGNGSGYGFGLGRLRRVAEFRFVFAGITGVAHRSPSGIISLGHGRRRGERGHESRQHQQKQYFLH